MTELIDHLVICSDCGIPYDEMPDSNGDWLIQEAGIRCPAGDPDCRGHILKSKIFCVSCQEKKAEKEGRHGTAHSDS